MKPLNNQRDKKRSWTKLLLVVIIVASAFYISKSFSPNKSSTETPFDYDSEKLNQIEGQNTDSFDSLEDALNATSSETLDQ